MRPALLAAALLLAGCATVEQVARLALSDDSRALRSRPDGSAPRSTLNRPGILFLPIDGVDRALLYDMLKKGELPGFAKLLGGSAAKSPFPHAHFNDTLIATMPSSTMPAWATVLTGVGPAQHGMAGNEFFDRQTRTFFAPIPGTFHEAAPTLACYTDDEYCNKILKAPTVYEQMRKRDPDVLIWVALHHLYAGADVLFVADRTVFAKAFEVKLRGMVETVGENKASRLDFETLDKEVFDVVGDALGQANVTLPDVLTVYLSGTDLYGHVAEEGPEEARRAYLKEVLDPAIVELEKELREKGMLDNRWVVITSDHGHTEVLEDEHHALATDGADDPPRVLEARGFRVREAKREVAEDADFQAVLAYQGAVAYVYTADRSTCQLKGQTCDWTKPPRFEEDVLEVAKGFYDASDHGAGCAGMKGTLDLVLARRPVPAGKPPLPYEVFDGKGLVPLAQYLAAHPRASYIDLPERLRDLAVGPYGDRAGDVMLIANNGDREVPAERYYFATSCSRFVTRIEWHASSLSRSSPPSPSAPLPARQRRSASSSIASWRSWTTAPSPGAPSTASSTRFAKRSTRSTPSTATPGPPLCATRSASSCAP
jgi:predicted AlkP superfamily pyrophosphatase or phosphodiesterase